MSYANTLKIEKSLTFIGIDAEKVSQFVNHSNPYDFELIAGEVLKLDRIYFDLLSRFYDHARILKNDEYLEQVCVIKQAFLSITKTVTAPSKQIKNSNQKVAGAAIAAPIVS